MRIVFGIFLLLHAGVHLLYFGNSLGYYELKPGLVWPDGSWLFSKFIENGPARLIAGIFLIIAAAGFIAGGAGVLLKLSWWKHMVVYSAVFSSLIYILFWDLKWEMIDAKGAIGILINIGILLFVLSFSGKILSA